MQSRRSTTEKPCIKWLWSSLDDGHSSIFNRGKTPAFKAPLGAISRRELGWHGAGVDVGCATRVQERGFAHFENRTAAPDPKVRPGGPGKFDSS
jgi:hypothetical protein